MSFQHMVAIAATVFLAAPTFAADVKLGEARTDAPTVAIEALFDNPTAYAGQRVRVEGMVTGVCPMKGCWMTLAAERGLEVRVKVEDGVVVIPKEAEGNPASAEGIVKVKDMTRDEWVAWHNHLAEETGTKFDATTVGDGPFQMVSIEGLGIEIAMKEKG